jgi:heterodisulfide reductase subunit C
MTMGDNKKFAERFNAIEMFRYCEQCGRCSSACPITGVNEFNLGRGLLTLTNHKFEI